MNSVQQNICLKENTFYFIIIIIFILFNAYLFILREKERKRERAQAGEELREGERESQAGSTLSEWSLM